MSLHQLAQQIQASGRGNDTLLVHMAPAEVRAMRKLAQQHGGDLSINPKTGLPEAGFLENILPTVVGAGVGIMTANPMLGAAAGGALGMAMNKGSIQSGLMAGLGAYGMGSLGAGIMETGAASLAEPAIPAGTNIAGQTANGVGANAWSGDASRVANAIQQPAADPNAWDKIQAGFQNTKFDSNFLKNNMLPIGMAAAPLLMNGGNLLGGNSTQQQSTDNAGYIRPYKYSQVRNPNYTGAGTPYFNQTMTPGTPIPSGEYGSQLMPMATMAEGGIADALSYYDTTKYAGVPASAVDATNSGIAQLAPPTYDPATRQYVAAAPEAAQAAQAAEAVRTSQANAIYQQQQRMAGYGSDQNTGGVGSDGSGVDGTGVAGDGPDGSAGDGGAAGSYAMGGGIGGNYSGFDGSNNPVNGNAQFNQGPQYPMQQPQNYAPGGITNSRQAAVQSYVAAAQKSPEAMKQLQAKAQGGDYDAMIALNTLQGTPNQNYAAGGGIYDLGSYSDGGRLLKGPGDGVSDDIPAQIGDKQPARLADGEFVVPARIVSELGNGSTDAGAKRLYAMMERVQNGRKKSVGKDKVAVDSKSYKHLPA